MAVKAQQPPGQEKVTCPACGAMMRLINGKYGEFFGCSNFPRCRATRPGPQEGKAEADGPTEPTFGPDGPQPASTRHTRKRQTPTGSPEQEEIWRVLEQEDCHVVVKALAGTGKSFTCREAMHRLPQHARVLYLAFNRDIVQEFRQGAPPNAEVSTLNAIGFRVVKQAFPNVILDADKVANLLAELAAPEDYHPSQYRALVAAVEKLVALAQGYLSDAENQEELLELACRHEVDLDIEVVDEVLRLVPHVLRLDRERLGVVSFNDQLWLPVTLNLPCPKYDVIFVDEAQDLNAAQHELVLRLLAPRGRVVVVGDDHQAIYGFRGSDVDSINNFTARLTSTGKEIRTLPLTVTRRCPKLVVQEAQLYVPEISALEEAPDGELQAVTDEQMEEENLLHPGDMVLCRCNAPLTGIAFRLIRRGTKAVIRGRDIGQGLVSLVQKLRARDINDLLRKLDAWQVREMAKVAGTRREETATQQIMDRVECILALSEDCDSITDLLARITSIFDNFEPSGAPRNAVVLSSIHRAKGLEAENVFWLYPEIQVKASQEWQQRQELNLRYVAVTRAKKRLVKVLQS